MLHKDQSIGHWISVLYRYGQIYLGKELKQYNIGSGQLIFILSLFKEDGITQETLSNRLNIDKATTARAIKKLEEEGYVIRRNDPKDKRANRVYITMKALEIKPILQKILQKWTNQLSINFTEKENELILSLLKKMSNNAASLIQEKE